MEGQRTSLLLSPCLHYCLLMVLGAFGIYVSMPIDFSPGSSVEWVDLIINLVIFVPCSLITVFSGLFAIICALFSYDLDRANRFKGSAKMVLRGFGLSTSFVADLVAGTKETVTNGLKSLGIPAVLLTKGPLRLLQKAVSSLYSSLFREKTKTIEKPEAAVPTGKVPVRVAHQTSPGGNRSGDED